MVADARAVVPHVPHLAGLPKGVRLRAALVAVPQQVVVVAQVAAMARVDLAEAVQHRVNPSHRNPEITVKFDIRFWIPLFKLPQPLEYFS